MKKLTIWMLVVGLGLVTSCSLENIVASDAESNSVLSGSYATMLTVGQRLYLVNKTTIKTFDVSNSQNPSLLDSKTIGFNIESLLHYNGMLFIGSQANMYIYVLDDQGIPQRQSETAYFNLSEEACNSDPIAVKNNIAYVTLATVNEFCGRQVAINEMRVYNISNLEAPSLLSIYPMARPKGLGVGREKLYVCDQKKGLVIYDIKDPRNPIFEKKIGGFNAYDLIVNNNILQVVANDQLVQFDITDENNIQQLSTIELK